jgi:hypothetical protein
MDRITRPLIPEDAKRWERISTLSIRVNKYLLWVPVLPTLFYATSMQTYLKLVGLSKTLPGFILIFGLLSYTLVYALSFALSPRYHEKREYIKSIAISLSPLTCIILAVTGHLLLPH